jgi:bifunctional DNA-binding transcriptional regulator/antitoxin component of YhaV-PrlF toxin-antitoxin module
MSERAEDETTVNDSYSVTIPAAVRGAVGIDAGDTLHWRVEVDGSLSVEVVDRRYGAFADLEPVDIGEKTDAATDHDLVSGDSG